MAGRVAGAWGVCELGWGAHGVRVRWGVMHQGRVRGGGGGVGGCAGGGARTGWGAF